MRLIPFLVLVAAPLRQFPGRTAIAVIAIALGVALGLAVQLVNSAAADEFGQAARRLSGAADLVVRGPQAGFDESLFAQIAKMPEVDVASPVVEVEAPIVGGEETLRIAGIDVFRAARLQPALIAEGTDPLDLLRPDTVFVGRSTLSRLGLEAGGRVRLRNGLEDVELRVAGVLAADSPAEYAALMDIAAVQSLFDRSGVITRIDVKLAPGVSRARFVAALSLPAGVTVQTEADRNESLSRMTRAYRVNLNVLALVALFTGALLVSSTQALSIARRRSQLALQRVIGFTRRQIGLQVVGEGMLLGVAGAVLGVVAGVLLARVVVSLVGADLGAGFFAGVRPEVRVDAMAVVLFAGMGMAAAVLGSLGPAWEAASEAPALALKSGDDARAFRPLRSPWPSVSVLIAGAGASTLPPVDGLPLFGYVSIAMLLLGTILLLPHLVPRLLARIPVPRSVTAALGLSRLRAYPVQAAVSLSAIVAAVSLMVAMAIMVTSFRTSLDQWLQGILPADLYVRAGDGGDTAYLSGDKQSAIAALDGVERVEFLRWQKVFVDRSAAQITLLARDEVDRDAEARLPIVGDVDRRASALPSVWVSESAAAIHGWRPGDTLALPLRGESREFLIRGLWRDYARQSGAVLIDRRHYIAATGDRLANDAGLWLTEPSRLADVRTALDALATGGLTMMTAGDVRELSLTIFDRTFVVTYALEGVAILIGLMGLSSAIGAEVLARRREFGMLRHLGVTRREIGVVLGAEGAGVAAVGLAVGAVLGFAMSLILIHVVNRQSFHWGMDLHVPWLGLAAFFAVMLIAATITAVASGRKAMGGDVVQSVREDW